MFSRSPFSREREKETQMRDVSERKPHILQPPQPRSLSPVNTKRPTQSPFNANVGAVNMKQQFYLFKLQDIVEEADNTVALKLTILDVPNETARYLDIDDFKTQLLGYTHDFPTRMNLGCQQLSGYTTSNNLGTHVIATAGVNSLSISSISGSLTSHNIIYSLPYGQPIWDISNISTLTFYLSTDILPTGERVALPLAQPVWLSLKIVRVIL